MLGVFRKPRQSADEPIPEALLANVPEIALEASPARPKDAEAGDPFLEARAQLDRAAKGWSAMQGRLQELERENARLQAALDRVRASLDQAR